MELPNFFQKNLSSHRLLSADTVLPSGLPSTRSLKVVLLTGTIFPDLVIKLPVAFSKYTRSACPCLFMCRRQVVYSPGLISFPMMDFFEKVVRMDSRKRGLEWILKSPFLRMDCRPTSFWPDYTQANDFSSMQQGQIFQPNRFYFCPGRGLLI